MLPAPSLSYTIPSIYDDTVLDARVYHPENHDTCEISGKWQKRAAIIAHPYAPLGGCYDDPIVGIVASAFLKRDFMVFTFNFRGAGNSKGRTSWTAKGEIADYVSIVGFVIYFMHYLTQLSDQFSEVPSGQSHAVNVPLPAFPSSPLRHQIYSTPSRSLQTSPSGAVSEATDATDDEAPILLLGGYSYGAMITSHLPTLVEMLKIFETPLVGTSASEIRLRAHQLALQQNNHFASQARSAQAKVGRKPWQEDRGRNEAPKDILPINRNGGTGVRIGGEETDADVRRSSHDSHSRSSLTLDAPECLRKSVDRVRSTSRRHERSSSSAVRRRTEPASNESKTAEVQNQALPAVYIEKFKSAYLLVSPLQGFITGLVTIWSLTNYAFKPKDWSADPHVRSPTNQDLKFIENATLAVYGDSDIFSSVKKLRAWSDKIRNAPGSRFQALEIVGASHFWTEKDVARRLKESVLNFIQESLIQELYQGL